MGNLYGPGLKVEYIISGHSIFPYGLHKGAEKYNLRNVIKLSAQEEEKKVGISTSSL